MSKRRIFDCFTFFNEIDLLRLRIEWLRDVVDFFVIAEASRTFTGKKRTPEFRFEDYDIDRYRIRYVLVDDLADAGGDAWSNERLQRNAILRGLFDLRGQDLIHVSDVDEIPAADVFERYRDWWISAALDQKLYYYQYNNLVVNSDSGSAVSWTGAKISTGRNLSRVWRTPDNLRRKILGNKNTWNRLQFKLTHRVISDAGWHWSYLMPPEQIAGKIQAFSHTEFSGSEFSSVEAVRRRVEGGLDPFDRGYKLKPVPVSGEFPRPLAEIIHRRFKGYVRNCSGAGPCEGS